MNESDSNKVARCHHFFYYQFYTSDDGILLHAMEWIGEEEEKGKVEVEEGCLSSLSHNNISTVCFFIYYLRCSHIGRDMSFCIV